MFPDVHIASGYKKGWSGTKSDCTDWNRDPYPHANFFEDLKEPPKIADPGCSKHIHIQKWQMNGSCKITWALTKRLLVTTKGSRVILDTFSLRTYQMPMTHISGSQLAPQFSGLALGAGAWAQQAPLKLIEESAVVSSTFRYWTCSLLDNIQDYTSIPVKSNP